MFGFGDDQVPFTESVDLLEDLVVEYITEMVRKQDFAHIYSPIVIKEITNSMQLSLLNLKDVYMPLEGKTQGNCVAQARTRQPLKMFSIPSASLKENPISKDVR